MRDTQTALDNAWNAVHRGDLERAKHWIETAQERSTERVRTMKHEIFARARIHHWSQYDDPDEIPDKGDVSDFLASPQREVTHVGYECSCGKRFNVPNTAADHLREVRAETERADK